MLKPTLYITFAEDNKFHLSAKRYDADSDAWESNNVELKAIWFGTAEATFNAMSNILAQAGITLIRD